MPAQSLLVPRPAPVMMATWPSRAWGESVSVSMIMLSQEIGYSYGSFSHRTLLFSTEHRIGVLSLNIAGKYIIRLSR
jgi:hypothetical protein